MKDFKWIKKLALVALAAVMFMVGFTLFGKQENVGAASIPKVASVSGSTTYILKQDGAQVTTEGWYYATYSKYYTYSYVNSEGYVSVIYFTDLGKCKYYSVSAGKYGFYINSYVKLNDGKLHYFASNGIIVTTEGWYDMSANKKLYVDANGYASECLLKGSFWKYYVADDNGNWVVQKNCWKQYGDDYYYFNANGGCTYIYYGATNTLCTYASGAYTNVSTVYVKIYDGYIYYFDANGVKTTKAGWYNIGTDKKVYVCKAGYVYYLLKKPSACWMLYRHNYTTGSWGACKKNVWFSALGYYFHFDASGYATEMYLVSQSKLKVYNGTKWYWVTDAVYDINGTSYYFDENGIGTVYIPMEEGWNKLSDGSYGYLDAYDRLYTNTPSTKEEEYTFSIGDGESYTTKGYFDVSFASELIKAINAKRSAKGLSALTADDTLTVTTQMRAIELTYGEIANVRPGGGSARSSFNENGICTLKREVIAYGYKADDIDSLIAYMENTASSTIFSSSFTTIGISIFVPTENDDNELGPYIMFHLG